MASPSKIARQTNPPAPYPLRLRRKGYCGRHSPAFTTFGCKCCVSCRKHRFIQAYGLHEICQFLMASPSKIDARPPATSPLRLRRKGSFALPKPRSNGLAAVRCCLILEYTDLFRPAAFMKSVGMLLSQHSLPPLPDFVRQWPFLCAARPKMARMLRILYAEGVEDA